MTNSFLSEKELVELTGFKKPKLQKRWLAVNGFSFVESGPSNRPTKPAVYRPIFEKEFQAKRRKERD